MTLVIFENCSFRSGEDGENEQCSRNTLFQLLAYQKIRDHSVDLILSFDSETTVHFGQKANPSMYAQ